MPSPTTEYDTATKYQRLGRPKKVLLGVYLWKRGARGAGDYSLGLPWSKLYLGDFGFTIKVGTSVRINQQAPY